ncbi:MAG TPA: type I-C CRISPR-associated protein Cas8c/Csd1 [Thermoanaerobaculia bacterium]
MLQPLVSYARGHGLVTEPGFAPKTVRWALVCDSQGKFLEVLDLADDPKSPGRTFPRCPELSQPEIKRGGPGCRHFLIDSADVVALLADGDLDAKLLAKHTYFTRLLRQAAEALPVLAGVADTLDSPESLAEIQAGLRARKAKPNDKVTFSILGASPAYPVDSDVWHDWWRRFRKALGEEKPGKPASRETAAARVRCLASGELVEPVPTHPKIAGLSDVGGLPMGDALASFKQESFCSYGLVQSANAPVSEKIAAEYRAALNHLIKETGRRLAGAKVVHWFKDRIPREEDPFDLLIDESTEEADAQRRARDLLTAIESGRRPDLLDNRYYALTLSGASGRVMVRDWMEGEFRELVRNVDRWFADLAIANRNGIGLAPPPRMISILAALVRDLDNLPPALEARMWHAAVRKEPIPQQAMARALARLKVDVLGNQPFNHARVGLLKAFHIRKGDHLMEPHLNESHPDPAYHCGRLMAMLAALQYRALGDVGAGVVQRYYAAASTTPALVLGRLVRTAQFHLDKLDRGLARWHEGRIADVFGRIRQDIPPTLSLERQSLFALGYYQQIAFDRSRTKTADVAEAPETSSDAQETGHE